MRDHQIAEAANQAAVRIAEVVVEVVVAAAAVTVVLQVQQAGNRVAVVLVIISRLTGNHKAVVGVKIKLAGIKVHGVVAKIKTSGNMVAVVDKVVVTDKIIITQIITMVNIRIGVDHRLVIE